VFYAAPVLKEQAAWIRLNEELTYSWDDEQRPPFTQKSMEFTNQISDTLSKKMVP
jgi:hypothetical protein